MKSGRERIVFALVALAIMAAGAGWLTYLRVNQRLGAPGVRWVSESGGLRGRIELPEEVLGFKSTNVAPSKLELDVLPQDTSLARRLYRSPDGKTEILLGVVLMGTDRTSIHKPEYCLTSQGWQIVGTETIAMNLDQPHRYALPVKQFTTSRFVRLADGRQVKWGGVYLFWFVAEGRLTASHWGRVGWLTWDLLRKGTLPRWAYVSAFVACPPGQEARAAAEAQRFLQVAVPQFQVTTGPPSTGVAVVPAGGSPQ
jgi:hypothetical protein